MRPTAVVDLVHRVEQDDVLHVGVLLERGRYIGSRGEARSSTSVRGGELGGRRDQPLGLQLIEEAADGRVELGTVERIRMREPLDDLLAAVAAHKEVPHIRPGALKAVVGAGDEVDDDRLTLDGLVDGLWVRNVMHYLCSPSSGASMMTAAFVPQSNLSDRSPPGQAFPPFERVGEAHRTVREQPRPSVNASARRRRGARTRGRARRQPCPRWPICWRT